MSFGLGYTITDCAVAVRSIPRRVRAILNKYSATMLLPGVAEPVLGPELITNGDFGNGVSNWVYIGSGSFAAPAGRGVLTLPPVIANRNDRQAYQVRSGLVVGKSYLLVANVELGSGVTQARVNVTDTVDTTDSPPANITFSASGTQSVVFTATATTMFLRCMATLYSGSGVVSFDNISVREILGYNHTRFSYQAGNYRESTGQTLAAVDQQVGLVVDAARSPGPELVNDVEFNDASKWAFVQPTSGSVSISGGKLSISSLDGTYCQAAVFPFVPAVVNRAVQYEINVESVSGSGVAVIYGGAIGPAITTPGVHRGTLIATSTAALLVRRFTNTATSAVITSFSVRELPGIHASQSTSGFQPVLRNTSGIQSWQFDGTDDRLSLSAVPFQMSDDHFVIGGATVANFSALRALFGAYSSSQLNPRMQMYCAQTTGACIVQLRGDSGASAVPSAGTAAANQPFVFGWEKQGSVVRALFDNAVSANASTASVGALTVDGAAIGETKGAFHNGLIHGLIVGKGAISASERQTLVKFIASLQGRTL